MARPTKHYGKWRIRPIDENGDRKSEVFDDRREAAFQLQQRALEAEERRRGPREARTEPKEFSDLADYWEKNRVPQKRSGHHDESILRRHLRPSFGAVTLGNPAIWIELVDKYVVERAHLNKKTVANHLTLLVTMLNVAVDLGWMTKVPRIRKPRVRLAEAYALLMDTLGRDLRVLDAHAGLGNIAFDRSPKLALVHYEMGVRIGELSFPGDFDGLLVWGRVHNCPFLRCMHGYGLCLWRLGDFTAAKAVFERMMSFNPNDNQGVRFCWDDVRHGRSWEEMQEKEDEVRAQRRQSLH